MAKQKLSISKWPDFREYVAEAMIKIIVRDLLTPGDGILAIDKEGWLHTNNHDVLGAYVFGEESNAFWDYWGRRDRVFRFLPWGANPSDAAPDGVKDWEYGQVTNVNDFDDPMLVVIHAASNFLLPCQSTPDRVPGKLVVSLIPTCDEESRDRSFRISVTKNNLIHYTFHVEVNGPVGEKVVNDGRSMRKYSKSDVKFIVYGQDIEDLVIRPLTERCGVKFTNTISTGKWHDSPFATINGAAWD